jgi:hypothetical protein
MLTAYLTNGYNIPTILTDSQQNEKEQRKKESKKKERKGERK